MAYHRWNWRDENEFYPSSVLKMQTVCQNSDYESYPVCQFYDFNVFNIFKKCFLWSGTWKYWFLEFMFWYYVLEIIIIPTSSKCLYWMICSLLFKFAKKMFLSISVQLYWQFKFNYEFEVVYENLLHFGSTSIEYK